MTVKGISRKRTELLAPAGTMEHLRAAVNSGADAVYAGGKNFSARAGAGNFDNSEMKEAAEYCRLRNVKLYVTMNTLIFDDEMEAALEYAKYLYEIGVDALIVQDLGFSALVREAMPDFPLHFSTQGTIYSKEGVIASARFGFERVVLAREVSLADMREIQAAIKEMGLETELEVFVHGALCFCFSGQCQMSRMRGGRSGNRGACAQPCRLPYVNIKGRYEGNNGVEAAENMKKSSAGIIGTSYKLSPKDLCTVDFLGELIDCDIASLKIEGRMKSPEYVALVVSIYRKYIDMYMREGFYKVADDDRCMLKQIFNRGGFTEGYFHENPGEKLMSGGLSKHQGVKIGSVVKRSPVRSKGDLVEIVLSKGESISLGDGIEIRNDDMPGNIVTYIKELPQMCRSEGEKHLIIGDIRGSVRTGDAVYKITDRALMEKAALSYMLDKDGNELTVKRSAVSMKFAARIGARAVLTVSEKPKDKGEQTGSVKIEELDNDVIEVSVESECMTEAAVNRPVTAERIRAQLAKTGGSIFFADEIYVNTDSNISIPMSAINAMRREALAMLTERKREQGRRILPAACLNSVKNEASYMICGNVQSAKRTYIYVHKFCGETIAEIRRALESAAEIADDICVLVPVKDYMEKCIERGSERYKALLYSICAEEDSRRGKKISIIPYISNVTMGAEDRYVRDHFDEIAEALRGNSDSKSDKAGGKEIAVGNLGWLCEFVRAGCRVTAGFGLNAVNGAAVSALKSLGASEVIPSLELVEFRSEYGTYSADRAPQILSYSAEGAFPLMISEHIMTEGEFIVKDRRSVRSAGEQVGSRKDGFARSCGDTAYFSMINTYGDKSLVLQSGAYRTLMLLIPHAE